MSKTKSTAIRFQLIGAALASTLFIPQAMADVVVDQFYTDQDVRTSIMGNITITKTGQLEMISASPNSGDAIVVNTDDAIITLDPRTIASNAIQTLLSGRNGITVSNADNTNIAIGKFAIISSVNTGIGLNSSPNIMINNSGGILGQGPAIFLDALSPNASIINNQGAAINTTGDTNGIYSESVGLTLENHGTIANSKGGDVVGIVQFVDFNSINNGQTGIINNFTGTGLRVGSGTATPITGTIVNDGLIAAGPTNVLKGAVSLGSLVATGGFTGTFTNSNTGVVRLTAGAGANTHALYVNRNFGSIFNDGLIENFFSGSAPVSITNFAAAHDLMGDYFYNTGTIQNTGGGAYAIRIDGDFKQLNNSGLIKNTTAGGTAISNFNYPIFVTEGIVNSGNILGSAVAAINLRVDSQVTLIQNAGLIDGAITLAGLGSSASLPEVLILNGGTINGQISTNVFDPNAHILRLNGGEVTDTIFVSGGPNTIYLNGSDIQGILGDTNIDTFNVTGGSFASIDGLSGADVMNILADFDQTGTVTNVPTINVKNSGTDYIVNGDTTGVDTALNIDEGTAALINAKFQTTGGIAGTGDINNAGTIIAPNPGNVEMQFATNTGDFILPANPNAPLAPTNFNYTLNGYSQTTTSGDFSVWIDETDEFGAMSVSALGANFNAGSISPGIVHPVFLPSGTTFRVVTGGPILLNPAVTIRPATAVLAFDAQVTGGTNLDLIVNRRTYLSLAQNQIAQQDAIVFDDLVRTLQMGGSIDADLFQAIENLDFLGSASEVTEALVELAPDVSYGLLEAAHVSMDRNFNSIIQRIEEVRRLNAPWYGGSLAPSGYSSGDGNLCPYGSWIKGMGDWRDQRSRGGMDGYRSRGGVIAVGMDRTFPNDWILGGAFSFTQVKVSGQSSAANVQQVYAWQGTAYTMFQPLDAVYVDWMVGVANEHFRNTRNINFGQLSASSFATFTGWQVGTQLDVGYVDRESNLYIVPVGRLKMTYLSLPDYTEHNAGGLSLSVSSKNNSQVMAGGGFRLANWQQDCTKVLVPELAAIYLYDFTDQAQQTVANFLGGGVSFPTDGVKPSRNILLVDLGLNAFYNENPHDFLTIRYELEVRDRYVGNSGYIELYHRWA